MQLRFGVDCLTIPKLNLMHFALPSNSEDVGKLSSQ